MISIIAAIANNRVIGKTNGLPWYLPADLKHFRALTTGKTIVMGLNTFKSIGEKPLPNRKNVVLANDENYKVLKPFESAQDKNCFLARSIDEVLKMTENNGELMVCGGAQVYKQFLPLADKLYLTFIEHDFDGDIFFPEFDISKWREISREDHQPDDPSIYSGQRKNLYPYSFVVLEKNII